MSPTNRPGRGRGRKPASYAGPRCRLIIHTVNQGHNEHYWSETIDADPEHIRTACVKVIAMELSARRRDTAANEEHKANEDGSTIEKGLYE